MTGLQEFSTELFFLVCLISLNIMISRCIHFFPMTSFLWLYKIPLCIYVVFSLSIHLLTSIYSGSVFWVLQLGQQQTRRALFYISLGVYPEVVSGSHSGASIFSFWEIPHWFPPWLHKIAFLLAMSKWSFTTLSVAYTGPTGARWDLKTI